MKSKKNGTRQSVHGHIFIIITIIIFQNRLKDFIAKKKNPEGCTGEPKTKACSKKITLERTAGAEPNKKQSANLSIVFVARGMNYLKFKAIW